MAHLSEFRRSLIYMLPTLPRGCTNPSFFLNELTQYTQHIFACDQHKRYAGASWPLLDTKV